MAKKLPMYSLEDIKKELETSGLMFCTCGINLGDYNFLNLFEHEKSFTDSLKCMCGNVFEITTIDGGLNFKVKQ